MTSLVCCRVLPESFGTVKACFISISSTLNSIHVHLRLFAAVFALTLLIPGCSRHGSTSASAVLRYPIIQEPSTMDPTRIQDVYTNELLQNVYEGLVGLGA